MWEEFLKNYKFWKGCLCAGIIASHFEHPTGPFCEEASRAPLWGMLLILILFHGCLETIILFSWTALFSLLLLSQSSAAVAERCLCLPMQSWVEVHFLICGLRTGHFHIPLLLESLWRLWGTPCSPCRDKGAMSQRSWGIFLRVILKRQLAFKWFTLVVILLG